MGKSRLLVAFAATIPPAQVAAKRRNIADEVGMDEKDVVVIDGATSLTLIPSEPDRDMVDVIRGVLEANESKLRQGNYGLVAEFIAVTLQQGQQ